MIAIYWLPTPAFSPHCIFGVGWNFIVRCFIRTAHSHARARRHSVCACVSKATDGPSSWTLIRLTIVIRRSCHCLSWHPLFSFHPYNTRLSIARGLSLCLLLFTLYWLLICHIRILIRRIFYRSNNELDWHSRNKLINTWHVVNKYSHCSTQLFTKN